MTKLGIRVNSGWSLQPSASFCARATGDKVRATSTTSLRKRFLRVSSGLETTEALRLGLHGAGELFRLQALQPILLRERAFNLFHQPIHGCALHHVAVGANLHRLHRLRDVRLVSEDDDRQRGAAVADG